MPNDLFQAELAMPELERCGSVEAKLTALQNYLFLLLENLRYTLRNLNTENFNSAELAAWQEELRAGLVVTESLIADELSAEYGAVADLTVDRLRTDWRRARRWLQGDTSELRYLYAHDEQLDFISATTDGSRSVQLTVDGRRFWWRDAEHSAMTSREETAWPVMVYVYEELVKASFRFAEEEDRHGVTTVTPLLRFGAGLPRSEDPTGTYGRGRLLKSSDGMELVYRTTRGVDTGLWLRDDGFADLSQRRASIRLDSEGGTVTVLPEGELARPCVLGLREDADGTLTLTWPDGQQFTVECV